MKNNKETLKNSRKLSTTQIITLFAGFLLLCTMCSQILGNNFLAERFAVLFYFGLIAATLSSMTENYHAKVIQLLTNSFNTLNKFNTQKQYRWAYLSYFIFVVAIIRKYGFTDEVAFLTLVMGWLMIYFPGYYFLILSGIYILIYWYLGESSTNDLYYSIAYFLSGLITTLITSKNSLK